MTLRPLYNSLLLIALCAVASVAYAQTGTGNDEVDVRALFGVDDNGNSPQPTEPPIQPAAHTPEPAPAEQPIIPAVTPEVQPSPSAPTDISPPAVTEDARPVLPSEETEEDEVETDVPATPPPEPVAPPPEPEKTWEDKKIAVLRALDKVTARVQTVEAPVGQITRFGDIFIKVQACREPPAIFLPESAAFLQIWDVPAGQTESRWVFSGWMFATSPALSAMDHPVYDVWVMDCKSPNEPKVQTPKPAPVTQPAPDDATDAAAPAD